MSSEMLHPYSTDTDPTTLEFLAFGSDSTVWLGTDKRYVVKVTDPGSPCPLSNQENKVKPNYLLLTNHLEGFTPTTCTQIAPFDAISDSMLVQPFLSNTGVEIEDNFLYLVSKTGCEVSINDPDFFELLIRHPEATILNESFTYIEENRIMVTTNHEVYRDIAEFTIQLRRHLLVNVAPESVYFPVPDIYGRNPLGPVKRITNLNLTNFKFSADESGTISALCIDPLSYYSLEYNAWVVIINRLISQLELQINQTDSGDEAL